VAQLVVNRLDFGAPYRNVRAAAGKKGILQQRTVYLVAIIRTRSCRHCRALISVSGKQLYIVYTQNQGAT